MSVSIGNLSKYGYDLVIGNDGSASIVREADKIVITWEKIEEMDVANNVVQTLTLSGATITTSPMTYIIDDKFVSIQGKGQRVVMVTIGGVKLYLSFFVLTEKGSFLWANDTANVLEGMISIDTQITGWVYKASSNHLRITATSDKPLAGLEIQTLPHLKYGEVAGKSVQMTNNLVWDLLEDALGKPEIEFRTWLRVGSNPISYMKIIVIASSVIGGLLLILVILMLIRMFHR